MLIFAVESSCDETAVALYRSRSGILAHKVHSQISIHSDHQGVVPELAARSHIEKLVPLTNLCLAEAEIAKDEIDAVAYTMGPGLIPCLMAGASYARAFAYGLGVPALGIHHLEGHLLSPLLADNEADNPAPNFPYVSLLVSGGHTQLYLVRDYGDYQLHGRTVDDAVGEAFDKTAVLLGLAYPGGATLEKLARQGKPNKYPLTMPMAKSGDYNFSFSGIKTQVRYLIEKLGDRIKNDTCRADIAASFQHTVVNGLVDKAVSLANELGTENLSIVGGVSANGYFRSQAQQKSVAKGIKVFFAPLEYCTDNAAMIALVADYRLRRGERDNLKIKATARCTIP